MTEQTEQTATARPTIARINSAYLTAQREVDAKLGYSNPYAIPIALKAIADAADRLGPAASVAEIVDAAFHGRLRGTVRKVLRQRGQLTAAATATATAPATPADPADRFVCDSPSVVDRPDFTTRGELDNPRGGWVAEFVPSDGTYRVSYPAMSGRVRVYRPVAADSPATSS